MTTDFRDKIRNPNCELCPLHEGVQHVCLMGDGTKQAEIMIVGEAPGAREDAEHRAFVGKAGKLLDQMLHDHAGLDRSDVYITNVNKCRPPDNRTPDRKEIKTCVAEYLLPEVKAVDPKWILALGNSALIGVLGKSGITKHRGNIYQLGDIKVLPAFHPAYALRNPRFETELAADFQRFGRIIRNEDVTPETEVKIVRTAGQLRWLLNRLEEAPEYACDVETGDPERKIAHWYMEGSVLTTVSFTWEAGKATVVPLWHPETPWKDPARVFAALGPALLSERCKFIAHNSTFDARWIRRFVHPVEIRFDTMIAAHMVDENRSKGLKNLAQLLLNADAYGIGEDRKNTWHAPLTPLCIYNGKDTDYTFRLKGHLKEELINDERSARIFKYLMMPAANALVDVENRGIQVDKSRWLQRSRKVEANCRKIERYMLQFVPKAKRKEFNFNSPDQVAEWLFEDLGLESLEETKGGKPSTKESVLLQLEDEHKVIPALLKWREWNKYRTTYIGPWKGWVDDEWKLHPTYKLAKTVTGRLSCSEPNLQNVPRNPFIRSILMHSKGRVFVQADYSQIELRIAAMVAHERKMLAIFNDPDRDIHLEKAVELVEKVPADVTKEERKLAKAVNFGFLYDMGEDKFIEYCRDNFGLKISKAEAIRARKSFFDSYPALRPWHNRQRRLAHRYGMVRSPLGRARHLPDIKSSTKGVAKEAERQAINSPVQSTASDLTLMSLVELHSRGIPIVGTVHDSILFDIPKKKLFATLPIIKDVMENVVVDQARRYFGAEITVPLVADIEYGSHWSDPSMEEWNG